MSLPAAARSSAGIDFRLALNFASGEVSPTCSARAARSSVTVDADDANEATVVGDLTLKGVTKPVTIEVEFNGAGTVMGAYKAGFDGEATIKRSDFGINYALPAVSDEVKLHIEGEFSIKK